MDYTKIASDTAIEKTLKGLSDRNFKGLVVADKKEAFKKILELIPQGASINNGSSRTLEEIGFVDYLKEGKDGWNNLHESILKETDPAKQGILRKQTTVSDFYLGSVHALTEEGEMVIASNSGSQLPALAFNAQNLILVVGAQKIVPTLSDAFNRIETHVIPLEEENMRQKYGIGTMQSKTLILRHENPMVSKRNVYVLIVKEPLGF